MVHETAVITNARGQKVFRQWWLPEGNPKAIVIIAHGLNEHSGRYKYFAEALTNAGYGVYTHDHVGHGQSEGQRLHIDSWSDWIDDICALVDEAGQKHAGVPRIMFGHSMGGAIATMTASRDPSKFTTLVLSGPLLGPVGASFIELAAVSLFSRILPSLPVAAIDVNLVARDKDVVEAYKSDPLNTFGKLPVRFCNILLDLQKNAGSKETAEKINIPVYIGHGSDDKIVLLSGPQSWIKMVPHENKELRVWDGLFHEILNETEKDQVIAEYIAWADKHVQ